MGRLKLSGGIGILLIAILAVVAIRVFAFTSCFIPSAGMEDSILPGERILADKWSYGLRMPFLSVFPYHRWCERPVRRQDIVVFNNPAAIAQPTIDRREVFISRCVGVPGDTLWVDSLFSLSSSKKGEEGRYPLIVPGKGRFVRVRPWNAMLLRNTLVMHEGRMAETKGDTLYVDGKPVRYCSFTKDYYWMSSNNAANLSDSRLFGFVPDDHLIGKAAFIWFSKEKNTGVLKGYRWNRFFRKVK